MRQRVLANVPANRQQVPHTEIDDWRRLANDREQADLEDVRRVHGEAA